jgi:superfamily II DNA or RNA helicase
VRPDVELEWVTHLTDAELATAIGDGALSRARGLLESGHVGSPTTNAEGTVIICSVTGSTGAKYTTVIRADTAAQGTVWHGSCTCPVGSLCKHVGAVLLYLRSRARNTGSRDWEDMLESILASQELESDGDLAPLGLQVGEVARTSSMREGRRHLGEPTGSVPRLRLRPVVRGKTGRWRSGGKSWQDVTTSFNALQQYLPDHVRALAHLKASAHGTRPEWQRAEDVYLDELDEAGWAALVSAYLAGVDLVGTGSFEKVLLAPGAQLAVDLTTTDDHTIALPYVRIDLGGGHRSEVGAYPPARERTAVTLEGDPAHGVSAPIGDGTLVIAPLLHPVDTPLRRFTEAPVEIPHDDQAKFLHGYLPVLRQVVDVTSTDGSVEVPDPLIPQLLLTVRIGPEHRSRVELVFRYSGGGEVVDVPFLEDPADRSIARDRNREAALLERAGRDLEAVAGLDLPHTVAANLGPSDTAILVDTTVPRLREVGVLVEVIGSAADFRRATDAPRVSISSAPGLEARTDWLDLRVSVHVGDEEAPMESVLSALAHDSEVLVLPSGTYIPLDGPELAALRRLVAESRELTDAPAGTVQVSRYRSDQLEELAHLDLLDSDIAAWASSLQALADVAGRPTPPPPAGLRADLRPYQAEGYSWLSMLWDARAGGILADDMGLGKTLQTLAVVQRGKEAGDVGPIGSPDGAAPVLVVCPTSVIGTWVHEAERFAPGLTVAPLRATATRRSGTLADEIAGADIVVTSYAIARLDAEDLAGLTFSALVLDEAQFVKNPRTATHRAVATLRAPRRLAMTGTPVENSVADLWSILALVTPGLLPLHDVFVKNYRKPIEAGDQPEVLEELRRRIRPFLLRRTKELVERDLPPKQEQVMYVDLSPTHQRAYDRHLQRERQRILGLLEDIGKNRVSVLSSLTTLRLAALDPALADREGTPGEHSTKITTLLEQLDAVLSEGHKVLVFSQFTGFLKAVRERLRSARIPHLYLDGATRDRDSVVSAFRGGEAPVFLISLKAGGFGLTLTEADYVFLLDPWWNPAAESQAVDRTHRIGQERPVNVYRLVSAGTIEEKVLALQERKRDLVARVVGDGAGSGAPLTAEDVRSLLEE